MAAKPAAKPPAKPKPTRKPKAAPIVSAELPSELGRRAVDPTGTLTGLDRRLAHLEGRLDRFERRLDKMADALAPALAAWRNIRQRIPRWLLSLGENGERNEPRGRDSEE